MVINVGQVSDCVENRNSPFKGRGNTELRNQEVTIRRLTSGTSVTLHSLFCSTNTVFNLSY